MTATGVDLKVVRDRLQAVHQYLVELRHLPVGSLDEFLSDRRNPPAAESHLRRALEALFDVARHLLSKGHGKGALEYKEVAQLAGEMGLLTDPELARRLVLMAGFRNRLVHFYREVTPEELYEVAAHDLGDISAAADQLREAAARLAGEGSDMDGSAP